MVNIKAKVISLPNEYGKDEIADYLNATGIAAKMDYEDAVKLAFILKAINLMQYVDFNDLPTATKRFFETLEIEVDGINYRHIFELLKPLRKQDIYELRINMREFNWRFRATFFPHIHTNGDKYYCFVFPFEKFIGFRDPTNYFRDKTFNIRYDVLHNPGVYAVYFK